MWPQNITVNRYVGLSLASGLVVLIVVSRFAFLPLVVKPKPRSAGLAATVRPSETDVMSQETFCDPPVLKPLPPQDPTLQLASRNGGTMCYTESRTVDCRRFFEVMSAKPTPRPGSPDD